MAAYALLSLAWVVGNPPFAGADEAGHYVRAVSIPTDGAVGAPVEDYRSDDLDEVQLAIVRQAVREVTVPAGLSPDGRSCFVLRPAVSAACLDEVPPAPDRPLRRHTNVGTYQPAFYVLPGYSATLAPTPEVAVGLARAVNAATGLVLLAAGTLVAWRPDRGAVSLLGPAVAVTPMVLATLSSLNPSGPEIAGGFALAAALLRLRGGDRQTWLWAVAGVAGAALVLGRSISPAWLVVHLLVFGLWHGPRPIGRLLRANRVAAAAAGTLILAALAYNLSFEAAHGLEVTIDPRPLGASLAAAWVFTHEALIRHAVGVFGYLEVPLPWVLYGAWWVLGSALWVLAFVLGTARQRGVLVLVTAGVLAAPVALEVLVLRHHGFHIQGRHLLPILVAVPLLAGEIVVERADRLPSAVTIPLSAVAVVISGSHFLSWYTNARRVAVGIPGTWAFPLRAEWAPPGGWLPWLGVAGAGAALLTAAMVTAAAGSRTRLAPPPGSSRTGRRRTWRPPRSRAGRAPAADEGT